MRCTPVLRFTRHAEIQMTAKDVSREIVLNTIESPQQKVPDILAARYTGATILIP